ncbi:UNVERIFIED_CONTAM: Formin-like protein 20 [Sesamum calycinum]|uniref:Formin-like protein 20 n=1 Tax=Sesamum calycinum TaxID=2727403 RepID=A0AAW2L6H2_9LAMI
MTKDRHVVEVAVHVVVVSPLYYFPHYVFGLQVIGKLWISVSDLGQFQWTFGLRKRGLDARSIRGKQQNEGALFRRFFYRKPPDRLLEISERVYVFDCCFSTDALDEDEYRTYLNGIVAQLQDYFPDASFMVLISKKEKGKPVI